MKKYYKNKTYVWQGNSYDVKKISGEIDAFSENIARLNLQQQGISITTIHRKRIFLNIPKKITALDISIFFRQLATLISAGIPIVQSFHTIQLSQENPQLKQLIQSIKQEIESGKNLTTGLKKFPRYFDDMICHLIHAGEQSGTLEIMLTRAALYKEKSIKLKQQIMQAMLYPMTIFFVAVIVSMVMLICVVPRFAELFHNMQGHLPLLTEWVIASSFFMRKNFFICLMPFAIIMIFLFYLKKSFRAKQYAEHAILLTPFIGNFIKKIILTRFTRNLAITFAAGIPILSSLQIIAHACGNHDYTNAILSLRKNVSTGQQLHVAMQKSTLFPPLTIQMIKIGEDSGKLDSMLEKIAEIYESDIDHFISNLTHLLEPLIMIVLGVLIGGLVIAMYLPIFKLGTVQ